MLRRCSLFVLLLAAAACSDRAVSGPDPAGDPVPAEGPLPDHATHDLETLARQIALALGDARFRDQVRQALDRSPWVEHKLHTDVFLEAAAPALTEAARTRAVEPARIASLRHTAVPSELYFPVPGQREAWDGGPGLLVATAMDDDDPPVAFDTEGRRYLLDPDRPPVTPVLALVPRETPIRRPGLLDAKCLDPECVQPWGSGGGSAGNPSPPPPQSSAGSLTLTHAQFVDDFEGWLKGKPEFEIHVLGPLSASDTSTMTSYQCVGEHAQPDYAWDMNDLSWNGAVKVFTYEQMDAFESAYPGRAYVIYAIEDDTDACRITTDENRFRVTIDALKRAYDAYAGAKDITISLDGVERLLSAARTGADVLAAVSNLITTRDDPIGIAVADTVAGRHNPAANWVVLDEANAVTGWLKLEMR